MRKISDSASVSGGGSAGSSSPGVRARVSRGGGGAFNVPGSTEDKAAIAAAESRQQQTAYQQRLTENQARYQSDKDASQRARVSEESETTTGRYERGGYVVQETRGKYEDLVVLGKQQPGSRLVQNEAGEYLLIRSTGVNLANEGTLDKVNEGIGLEGGSKYSPTEKRNEAGGIDYNRKLVDTSSVSTNFGGSILSEEPSKETGYLYTVKLHDELGPAQKEPYQKTRAYQPREIAEEITLGLRSNEFIGSKGADIKGYETIAADQQKFGEKQVFPITYIDAEGKPLVTITGKSKGSEFQILSSGKNYSVNLDEKITTSTPTKNIVQLAEEKSPLYPYLGGAKELVQRTAKNIGIDIVMGAPFLETGVPQYTKPVKEKLLGQRKETQIDLLTQPERYGEIKPLSKEFIIPATVYVATGLIGGKPKLPKLTKAIGKTTKSPILQEQPAANIPKGTAKRDLYSDNFTPDELINRSFKSEQIPLGVGAVKTPPRVLGNVGKPVKEVKGYEPSFTPRSTITETKINLGKGIGINLSKSPVKQYTSTTIGLGEGEVKRPGIDFTSETVGLGKGAVKTPPQVLGTIGKPVKIVEGYEPSFTPRSALTETKIRLGKGAVFFPGRSGPPKRTFVEKPQKPQSKETEIRISKGLQLIMAPQKEKQYASTKIQLGSSDKILQIQEGKVIRNTLTQTKAKPSQSFYSTPKQSSLFSSEYEYTRYPPESKIKFKQTLGLSSIVTPKQKTSITTTQKIKQEERGSLLVTPRQSQKQKQRFTFSSPFGNRQTPAQKLKQPLKERTIEKLIEVPREIPPPKLIYAFKQPPRPKKGRSKESLRGSRLNFFGNVPQESIIGVFGKKQEITYSQKRQPFSLKDINPKRRKKSKKKESYGLSWNF